MRTERAAVYCRVSTDGQKMDGTSLDSQERECRAYCEERGYAVVMVESEQGSGATLERLGLTRILAAIERGEVDVLMSLALDRLSRKQTHVAIVASVCEDNEARLEFVTEDFEEGSVGTFIRGAKAFAAELEREKIRYRTMSGKRDRLTEGNVPTWTCDLYGYRTLRPSKDERRAGVVARREVVPVEAAVVVEVFEMVASGHSRQAIADTLNARGVDSPGVTRMTYANEHRPRWQPSSIGQMVVNPAYRGLTVANRLTRRKVRNPVTGNVNNNRQVWKPEEEWTVVGEPGELTPALVDADRWHIANERLSANRGTRTRNAQAPMLLRNRVYCAVCGGLLHAEHSTRPGRRSYYRCKQYHPEEQRTPNDRGRTPMSLAVAQADLDDWVWSAVRAVLVDRREVVAEIRRRLEGQGDAPVRAVAERLTAHVATIERQRAALLRSFTEAEGAMPWATIAPELTRLEREHAEATRAADAAGERRGKSAADLARLDGLDAVARRLGPRLTDPDLDTRVQVVAELGLTVRATRLHQTLEWSLPLTDGEQSGWGVQIDLSHVVEPDEATLAAVLAEGRAEAFAEEPDESGGGTGGRGADRRSGSRAGRRRSRSTSTSTASPTDGATSGPRPRSRRWSHSSESCRWPTAPRSTSWYCPSASTSAPAPHRSTRAVRCATCAPRSG